MRTPVLLTAAVVALVALPSLASGGPASREDGTLSIRDGRGDVTLNVRGAAIGRFTRGQLVVTDYGDEDENAPVVRGCDIGPKQLSAIKTLCAGTNIRFRMIGGRWGIKLVNMRDLDASVVGRGRGTLDGDGDFGAGIFFDGTYSLNGDGYRSLPDDPLPFTLGGRGS